MAVSGVEQGQRASQSTSSNSSREVAQAQRREDAKTESTREVEKRKLARAETGKGNEVDTQA